MTDWISAEGFLIFPAHLPPLPVDAARIDFKGQPLTVIRHTPKNHWALEGEGIILPRLDMDGYDWPGRFVPFAHQRDTATFLAQHRRAFCTNDAGTGKTLSALWAADYLIKEGVVRRVLIVAPKSICAHVWEREIFQTTPHLSAVVMQGARAKKIEAAANKAHQVVIVNPESLGIIEDHLPDVDLIIVDEFTKFKSVSASRYKVLRRVAKDRMLWMMSGTPAPQSPLDAYGPIQLVNSAKVGMMAWKEMTMQKVTAFKWISRQEAPEIIAKYMVPCVRHKLQDCVDMPELSMQVLEVDLTKEQERLIEELRKEAVANLNGVQITAANAAVVRSKLFQIMGGGVYHRADPSDKVAASHPVDASPLIEAISDFVESADTPVIVFSSFKSSVAAISEGLGKAGHRVATITGDVPAAERSKIFDRIQAGELDALVAVPGTMSHGVTLTASRYVVWATPPDSFETYSQAVSRIYRTGQKNRCVVTHIIQNSLAKLAFNKLESQSSDQELVLALMKGE